MDTDQVSSKVPLAWLMETFLANTFAFVRLAPLHLTPKFQFSQHKMKAPTFPINHKKINAEVCTCLHVLAVGYSGGGKEPLTEKARIP